MSDRAADHDVTTKQIARTFAGHGYTAIMAAAILTALDAAAPGDAAVPDRR
jgi:methylmalonyl-CoA mutase cobalamin-binding subunit